MRRGDLIGALLALTVVSGAARAVVVASGAWNTNAPSPDPGFGRIGRLSNVPSTVTYLSNGWFITAYHVQKLDKISGHPGPTGVVLGGVTYSVDDSSWTRLNDTTFGQGYADAVLFRVQEPVAYSGPDLSIRSSAASGAVTMMGDGRTRQADTIYWATNSAGVWVTTNQASALATGFWLNTSAASNAIAWGTNTVSQNAFANLDGTYGTSIVFRVQFDPQGGNEAQAVLYDSGGGAFIKNGPTWQLAGMNITVDTQPNLATLPGQAVDKVVYGMGTRLLDLAYYRTQILNTIAIPEPGVLVSLAGGLFALRFAVTQRRQRSRRHLP